MLSFNSRNLKSISRLNLIRQFKHDIRSIKKSSLNNYETSTINPTSTSSYTSPFMERYLQPLKNPAKPTRLKTNLENQSFFEIDSSHLKPKNTLTGHFSTKHDDVPRPIYEKEVIYLKNMLDTFSNQRYFDRSLQIFKSLSMLVTYHEFTQLCNKYLETICINEDEENKFQVQDLKSITEKLTKECNFISDARTDAIVLTKMLKDGENVRNFLNDIEEDVLGGIKQVLKNSDIIGLNNYYKLFDSDFITKDCIPKELQEVYHEYKMNKQDVEILEDTIKLQTNKLMDPLQKDNLKELLPVESFGLKVVRHSLLGLKPNADSAAKFSIDIEEIIKDLEEKTRLEIEKGKLNYHEIYKKLETDDQRTQFNEALEAFNIDRQKELEIRGIEGAKEKWKHDFEEQKKRGDFNLSKSLNAQCYRWYRDLVPLIKKEQVLCKALLEGDTSVDQGDDKFAIKEREFYAPYFMKINPEKAPVVALLELLKLNATGGVLRGMRVPKCVSQVGKAIELEYRTSLGAKKDAKLNINSSKRKKVDLKLKKIIKNSIDGEEVQEWDNQIKAKIGGVLIAFIMSVAKVKVKKFITNENTKLPSAIEEYHPAFYHGIQFVAGSRVGVLKLHNELIKNLSGSTFTEAIQPQSLPMLVEPKPWDDFYGGGNSSYSRSPLVRMKDAPETEAYLKTAAKRGNLDEVFDGLNVLGKTAWTVNKQMFDVISHYWNKGEEVLSIPPVVSKIEIPEKLPSNADPLEKFEQTKKINQALLAHLTAKSQRCDHNYKLEIARGFIGEKIYFPHNLDFRGRAYPLSPHFNHLGNDLTRSLVLFWDGKELGESGLKWLKIHLANVYGFDKAPFQEREKFVDDNLQNIFNSANDPLAENAWWKKADKPWQTLSVCFELNEASKLSDPTKFKSHLPVHQDGSCNGLQHYAALGGDIEGAKQVNLLPSDRPQDVYSFVARLVDKRLEAGVAIGDEMAKFWSGKVTRKVIKQTVMTNVYGVTFVGAVLQIRKQVEKYLNKDDVNNDNHILVRYLTKQVFDAIRELFENAHAIQDWLGDAAKIITKSVALEFGQDSDDESELYSSSVIWTTPIGLPCVQPYRNSKTSRIKTSIQEIFLNNPSGTTQVDSRKQQSGFPPNFIHSLDATHMLMTAKQCGLKNLDFASVHDSFWTHAADIDIMNKCIREQFVKLHSANLVELLRDEFIERYKGFYQTIYINGASELAKRIKSIKQQWSKSIGRPVSVTDELYMERKRLDLLKSDNPKDVKAGKEMVTTISIIKDHVEDLKSVKEDKKYKDYTILVPLQFPEVPKRGGFDLKSVEESSYFFA
ncbi:unnamed protein product [Candida verbasci]|uniref:DNA-directed RNA polymerase n=1 Tax=Candida verbasci TaxID=1227364 RepID=A0A9W4TXJ9_9ASCO|nr:unnamed protein product [Candida verbasci]